MEQRKKLFCLIIYGTMVQRNNDFSEVTSRHHHHHHYQSAVCSLIVANQEKMRDLAEKLFNTRCGVMVEKVDNYYFHYFHYYVLLLLLMVEKVNNRYYHCYYHWWLRRWETIVNIISWSEHKNSWITTIYTVNPNPRMTSLTWSWSQYLEAPPSSQNLFLSDSTTSTSGEILCFYICSTTFF